MSTSTRIARVIARRALSPRVNELVLAVEGEPEFRWRAGQYVTLEPEGGTGGHEGPLAYSIASAAGENPRLVLAIGPGSGAEVLASVVPGSALPLSGPFGFFTLEPAPGALLVGVGTGIAPLHAHVEEWTARGTGAPIVLLAGARNERELLWDAELREEAARSRGLRYEPVLSQPGPSWTGRSGYVQGALGDIVPSLPPGFVARLCGNRAMVESCLTRLGELGVPAERIEAESY